MRCFRFVIAGSLLFLAASESGQAGGAPPNGGRERAASAPLGRLHRLNVAALDEQGQPVTGLRSADFQLFEDGKPRDIAFFRFTGARTLLGAPDPREYSNRAVAARHVTVVLIDLLNDPVMNESIVTREVAEGLRRLESSDGLYLYMLTARGELYPIHPLPKPGDAATPAAEPWTRDIAPTLQAALKDLVRLKPVDDREIKVRFELTVNALRDLGSQMAQFSGRKNLVWLTRGIRIIGYSISAQSNLDFTQPLRRLGEELEQEQIVVYTVAQSPAGAAVEADRADTFDALTGITGGREYSSDRAGDAIQQAMADSRANYEIAYYSAPLNSDGKHHKIRVVCGRKDVRLQTKLGFYAVAPPVSPGNLAPRALRSAETAADSPFDATDIGLRASVSPDPVYERNMRFEIHIDPADLLPRHAPDRDSRSVFVMFAAYDEGLKQPSQPIVDSLSPEEFEAATHGETGLRYAVPLQPAILKVRVIVYDAELGTVGSVTIPVRR
jgi:VWFA-related protein